MNISCVLVLFPITMTIYSDNNNLKVKGFIWLTILGYHLSSKEAMEPGAGELMTSFSQSETDRMREWLHSHSFSISKQCRTLCLEKTDTDTG